MSIDQLIWLVQIFITRFLTDLLLLAQYDQLGGTSQVSDEGVAPVTSVIGVLDNQRNNGISSGQFSGSLPNSYLPTNLRA